MRDIIFRGRQKGGTGWFYGDLSYLVHDKQKCYIFPPDGYNSPDWYEVDSNTVGQYTGLIDKNGKKIFEGDILNTDLERPYSIVVYRNGCFMLELKDNDGIFYDVFYSTLEEPKDVYPYTQVIGNIYDTPLPLEATP